MGFNSGCVAVCCSLETVEGIARRSWPRLETRVRAWAADTIAKNMDRMMKKTVTQYIPKTMSANTRLSTCAEHLPSNAVRIASKMKKRPPTTSSPGDDARRWREGVSGSPDAATHKFISSPSKSALYGEVHERLSQNVE